MTKEQRLELVTYKLSRSKETIREAELLLEHDMYNSSMNRLYYACFYGVSALLIFYEISAKTHSGAKQMLSKHFIITGKMKNEYGRFYAELFDNRQMGDYDDLFYFTKEDVIPLLQPSKKFLAEIEHIIGEY